MMKPFCAVIWHGASNKPEVYLEPSQTTTRECFFGKIVEKTAASHLQFLRKNSIVDH